MRKSAITPLDADINKTCTCLSPGAVTSSLHSDNLGCRATNLNFCALHFPSFLIDGGLQKKAEADTFEAKKKKTKKVSFFFSI